MAYLNGAADRLLKPAACDTYACAFPGCVRRCCNGVCGACVCP
ncbi:hypothetical protein LX16_4565 [Stackebrandtia albiflava]|uniref:Uncharacterized protein n=1 Tax=Stackebrandtia albiflava TaxID=406432 RepID=A0A562URV8_9ACTN|nr:hypothetical protein [Stackebrandtia albiflava]TWJ08337.1 hypothetical protein LX16_4565 [Stackebrandtia albiflava]